REAHHHNRGHSRWDGKRREVICGHLSMNLRLLWATRTDNHKNRKSTDCSVLSQSRVDEGAVRLALPPDIQCYVVQQEPCRRTLTLDAGEGDADCRAAVTADIEASLCVRRVGYEITEVSQRTQQCAGCVANFDRQNVISGVLVTLRHNPKVEAQFCLANAGRNRYDF